MPTKKNSIWNRITGRSPKAELYISYSRKDGTSYAFALATILTKRGFKVYFDRVETTQGEYLLYSLRDVLQQINTLIVIGTSEAFKSKFVHSEIEFFYQSKGGAIIPIIFGGQSVENIPPILLDFVWLNEQAGMLAPSEEVLNTLLPELDHSSKSVALNQSTKTSQLINQDMRPLNEGKLILVGGGEVGKTSIVRRLVDNEFQVDEFTTHGIKITNWQLNCNSGQFKLNIWDFGGQEMMHATHQFFLTEQSIYLLVLNGREGGVDIDADYWLKLIESFGGESPVIVVQNKIEQHSFELNYRGLKARYPQIRTFVKTDCKDLIGLDILQMAIQNIVESMPEIGMSFPSDWFRVKEKLESMKDEYIGSERFSQLCYNEGIKDESHQNSLKWFLHCLGIALNYSNDSRLKETSVLKPEWVTHGIYGILNAKSLAERQGELQLNELQKLLPQNRYPANKHLFLIELMRKFSLCFSFYDDNERYLIPELLGKEEPHVSANFAPSECLNFEYHYGILPEGIVPRFIVRSHTLSRNQERWRTGVILIHEDCKALVKAELAERRVIIRVKGTDAAARRRLLAIIRYDFDAINAEFKDKLDAQAKVPLVEFPEFSIDYQKLVAFEKQGVNSFPEFIGQRVVTVQVSKLLNGVDLEKQREVSTNVISQAKVVFFSYSHKDESLRDELEVHLKLLQRQGVISAWHDRKIMPGNTWAKELDNQLKKAKIILLLISADFLASDYTWEKEIRIAMERHNSGDATIIPILLRQCDWSGTPFEKLQSLPKDKIPVTLYKDRDSAWTEVAAGIRAIADKQI